MRRWLGQERVQNLVGLTYVAEIICLYTVHCLVAACGYYCFKCDENGPHRCDSTQCIKSGDPVGVVYSNSSQTCLREYIQQINHFLSSVYFDLLPSSLRRICNRVHPLTSFPFSLWPVKLIKHVYGDTAAAPYAKFLLYGYKGVCVLSFFGRVAISPLLNR